MSFRNLNIDKTWTLFLDRDGVINRRLPGDYVKNPEEFELLGGVAEAIKIFNEYFGRVIVVSNQQGVGKGIMSSGDLEKIDLHMHNLLKEAGGRLDKAFYAPMLHSEKNIMRKPGVGMALAARKTFPEINFKRCFMAGDTLTDMQFGKNLKMKTVLINETNRIAIKYPFLIDYHFTDLYTFAKQIAETSPKKQISEYVRKKCKLFKDSDYLNFSKL